MTLPDLHCIGFDGKPAVLVNRQIVHRPWQDKKGKWHKYGYEVSREVPLDRYEAAKSVAA